MNIGIGIWYMGGMKKSVARKCLHISQCHHYIPLHLGGTDKDGPQDAEKLARPARSRWKAGGNFKRLPIAGYLWKKSFIENLDIRVKYYPQIQKSFNKFVEKSPSKSLI